MGIGETPADTDGKPPLALIAGPTASGKSGLAVAIAKELQRRGHTAVIINADSAQVYADLRILSARPSTAEMAGIEHRLFGAWDGAQVCSAAEWAAAAKGEIAAARQSGSVPILCGGTGLYMRTLLNGIAPIPEIDPAIREAVRSLDKEAAFHALGEEDPERASRLSPGDSQRIARALEVVRSTGRNLSNWQARQKGGILKSVHLSPLLLLPSREILYDRCDRRFTAMLDDGAIAEVEALLARNLSPDLPVMHAIGVRETAAMIRGEIDRAECIARATQATRNYAKRQYTWFRRQPPDDWPRVETAPDSEAFVDAMTL